MRRLLTVAFLAVLVSTSAACGNDADSSTSATASTSASAPASASPSAAASANTKNVCDKAEQIVTRENATELGRQIGLMIVARQQNNSADEAKAKAAIKSQTDTWAKQLRDLKAEASDPATQAALDKAANGIAMISSDEYLAKIKTVNDVSTVEKDLTAAGADLETACS